MTWAARIICYLYFLAERKALTVRKHSGLRDLTEITALTENLILHQTIILHFRSFRIIQKK